MTSSPSPPNLAGTGTENLQGAREGLATRQLLGLEAILSAWRDGSMEAERAVRRARRILSEPSMGNPNVGRVLQWENDAHAFRKELTKTLNRAWWHLLGVLQPPEAWPMGVRAMREAEW